MNLENVSLQSALPGTNLVAPFSVISNVLRTAKPLFFIISNAPGPCAGRRFGPLLGGGARCQIVTFRKISKNITSTGRHRAFSLADPGREKCALDPFEMWTACRLVLALGRDFGRLPEHPPRTPNFGRISEEFWKRFPTYCVALRCVCVCAALNKIKVNELRPGPRHQLLRRAPRPDDGDGDGMKMKK